MKVIYRPRNSAGEYEKLAVNPIIGCDHGCSYCYGPSVMHISREEFRSPRGRDSFLHNLAADARKLEGCTDHVLIGFICDPYCRYEATNEITRHTIDILHAHGLRVSILTKGGYRACRDLTRLTPEDRFGATLTFLRDADSLEWEPGAADPFSRIFALREAHLLGIPTWVSLEPVIDPRQALELLRLTAGFVDEFKIGRLNYRRSTFDLHRFGEDLALTLQETGARYYIKESLLPYMPQGFPQSNLDTGR